MDDNFGSILAFILCCILVLVTVFSSGWIIHRVSLVSDCERYGAFYVRGVRYTCHLADQ